MDIDWQLIAKAIKFYQDAGYAYVEVPWIVPHEVVAITLPEGKAGMRTQDGTLIGSAEQGFLHLMLDGRLPPGRYVAASPCFRDDEVDALHQRAFLKVELIWVLGDRPAATPIGILNDAFGFFRENSPWGILKVVWNESNDAADIELGGVEIGSYGLREHKGLRWAYGTGLAEPRFSTAMQMWGKRKPGKDK